MKLISKIKHWCKLITGTPQYYCQTRTGDEASFWQAESQNNHSLLRIAHDWKTGPAYWYLSKIFLVRIGLGVVVPQFVCISAAIAIAHGLIILTVR